jgi:hypothetical protein
MMTLTKLCVERQKPSRNLILAAQLMAAVMVWSSSSLCAPAAEPPVTAQFRGQIQPILKEYCYDCHGDGESKGKIAFDQLNSDQALMDHDLWLKVIRNLRAGLMPPNKKPAPNAEQKLAIDLWVKNGVFGIDPKNPDPGRVTVRRLNRTEYRNTVRDLVGIDYDTPGEFPPDDTGYGFDNIGDVLTVSPMLLEKYLIAADQVISQSVPLVTRVLPEKITPGSRFVGLAASEGRGGGRGGFGGGRGPRNPPLSLSYYQAAAVSNEFNVDVAGDYKVTLDLAVKGAFEFDPGRCRVTVSLDGNQLMNEEFGWYNDKAVPREFPEKLEPGKHHITIALEPLVPVEKKINNINFNVVDLNLRGPMDQKLWTKPANYDKFFSRDEPPKSASERRKYAREILTAFATKAFRRPVDSKTVDRLVPLAEEVYNQPGKTFEAGIAHAMVAVLASPRFIFRMEENVKNSSAPGWGQVDEYTLASRLSYFLWSSMPDQELLDLAGKGQLRKNLDAQVKRMVADSRSAALSQNFTGQWLEARDVDALAIDARAVLAREGETNSAGPTSQLPDGAPRFGTNNVGTNNFVGNRFGSNGFGTNLLASANAGGTNSVASKRLNNLNVNGRGRMPRVQLDANTKRSMRSETEMYFANILHENRSVMEFIESDYLYANTNLAKIYGLTNAEIRGNELVKVTLPPDSPRGGILTEGTVLTVTSNPDRTSPVKRGLFILNNILGTPVPPPPPNVPALEATESNFKDHQPTLREALEIHRQNALCSSCHSRMDPIGLGMENFNALGLYRDKERGQTIETAGVLSTGETFNSVQELKHILATNHKYDFYRCLTGKLLTYALGRGLEYYDVETVDQIVARVDKDDGRFNALLMGIIDSAPFQEQRNRANATLTDDREPSKDGNATQLAKSKPPL